MNQWIVEMHADVSGACLYKKNATVAFVSSPVLSGKGYPRKI